MTRLLDAAHIPPPEGRPPVTTTDSPPTIYGLPPEPGPEVTDLWDCTGQRWMRVPPQPPHGASWMPWELLDDEPTLASEAIVWEDLLYECGPMTTDPEHVPILTPDAARQPAAAAPGPDHWPASAVPQGEHHE